MNYKLRERVRLYWIALYDTITYGLIVLLSVAVVVLLILAIPTARADEPSDVQMLQLMKAQYQRDIMTDIGRAKWHGQMVLQIIDTNALKRIDRYADGTCFTNDWRNLTAEKIKADYEKAMRNATNGVPERLAKARLRRMAEKKLPPKVMTIEIHTGDELKAQEITEQFTAEKPQPPTQEEPKAQEPPPANYSEIITE